MRKNSLLCKFFEQKKFSVIVMFCNVCVFWNYCFVCLEFEFKFFPNFHFLHYIISFISSNLFSPFAQNNKTKQNMKKSATFLFLFYYYCYFQFLWNKNRNEKNLLSKELKIFFFPHLQIFQRICY